MKTLTEIAIECSAEVMPKSESGLTTKLIIDESQLQTFVDAVNAQNSEPVWQGLDAKEIASIPLNEYTVQTVEKILKEKNK